MNGEGEIKFNDGQKYKGSFKSGLKDGFGIMNWSNGNQYQGFWNND